MSQHSPAPFGAHATPSSDPYNIRVITDAEGNHIATIRHLEGMPQEEALANAALFKAAPAMLFTLEVIKDQLELLPDAHIGNKIVHFALMQAVNAIAEAKGEK